MLWLVVLEKALESPLDCKEIQTVHPKGNQSWIFTGKTDAEAETPYFHHLPDWKNWLIWIDPNAGKDWRWEKGTVRMRWLDGINNSMDTSLSRFRDLVMDSLVCYSPLGRKELDMTERLNWAELTGNDYGAHVQRINKAPPGCRGARRYDVLFRAQPMDTPGAEGAH